LQRKHLIDHSVILLIEDVADHYSSKAKPILEESVTATSQPIEITTEDETSSLNTKQQLDKR
jgi:hypothetical protein